MNGGTSARVIEAVASAKGVEATELPPLSDVIDPDALDRLVAGSARGTRDGAVEVQFEYADYVVTARYTGDVRLQRRSTDGRDVAGE